MKHFLLLTHFKRLALLTTLLICSITTAFADDFDFITVDGIKYVFIYSGSEDDAVGDYAVVDRQDEAFSGYANIHDRITYEYEYTTIVGIDENHSPIYGTRTRNLTAPVKYIINEAFYQCTGLTGVNIPNSIIEISQYAFAGCRNLTSVNIPNSVTSIENCVFSDCSSLTRIDIPNSVTSIGYKAFSDCSNVTCITIPISVTTIDDYAFSGCNPIELMWNVRNCFSNGKMSTTNIESLIIGNEVETLPRNLAAGSKITQLVIPESVTTIGAYAFSNCQNLTQLVIPGSVTTIENHAFNNCKNLTQLVIPESVTTIGDFAFSGTDNLKKLIWNAKHCTSNGSMTTKSLEDITIGPEVEILPDAFAINSQIDHIDIPTSVTSIGGQAFSYCLNLTEITIPESVTYLGPLVFYGSTNLRRINWNAINCSSELFYSYPTTFGCDNVKVIAVGSQVESIGGAVFQGCNNVDSVISYATTPPAISDACFSGACYDNATLYVPDEPEGTIELYKDANGWKNFYPRISTITVISFLLGDVNGDGVVNIADLSELIDILLRGDTTYNRRADVDQDGQVGISDVAALIDILLRSN